MKIKRVIGIVIFLLAPGFSEASEKLSVYEQMGSLMWASFSCAALAKEAKEGLEHDRLFEYGYMQGKKFLLAYVSQEVSYRELATSRIPVGIVLSLEGPSIDFVLGRIYEMRIQGATSQVQFSEGKITDVKDQPEIAKRLYREQNCSVIGVNN